MATKIEQARAVYAKHAGKPRLEIIDILQAELGLARGTAAGYHDACKKAASKDAPVPSKEAWKKVGEIAKEAMAGAPKLSAPPTETKSAIVAAAAKEAKIEVIDLKPKKNIASGENKPLHNFTGAEILAELDPKVRAEVEASLNRKVDVRSLYENK